MNPKRMQLSMMLLALIPALPLQAAAAAQLWAGVAKVDITNEEARPVHDRLYAKALVLRSGTTTAAIITIDAVAIAEIGTIRNDYLAKVRARIQKELHIEPSNVLVNASHCHGSVRSDVDQLSFEAVRQAARNMVPVNVGAGTGYEDRIMENRRMKLKDGREADVRRAYSLPPDSEVVSVGPVDPQIGILRLDRKDGRTLAVIYNFACHPIEALPNGANSADIVGFASKAIEDTLGDGAMAFFLQGAGGDVNPIFYKDVDHPRNPEALGDMLGLSTLRGLRMIRSKDDGRLTVVNHTLELPRADTAKRIRAMEAEQATLLRSLKPTDLNLKTFIPLLVKYNMSAEFPSYYSYLYLHEKMMNRDNLISRDAENRKHLQDYISNIHTMEKLTRLQTNLALLRKHQADNLAAGKKTLTVEIAGVRIGDFVLVTFPGELTVEIGLGIKKRSPHKLTFVAGYTNGYIYYTPTAEQLKNVGGAQEDSDCLVAPEWQAIFERKVAEILETL
ncbi:MAG: hypothetical protein HUU41_12470 [Bryobacteraceae bacterium]|nr:hypothetical protein [Bryobacterales bacterium]MEB2363535.1 hypothetical protein [Bryobacterales bacterium]NUN01922.1 hypothetical protein [Bryobacteraceae bacterium]